MRKYPERARNERGLVGKIMVVWLALLVLLGLAAVDAARIAFARYKVADAAEQASFEAASIFEKTQDQSAAYQTALQTVSEIDAGAKVRSFTVNAQTGEVTVSVSKKASTLLAGRFFKDLVKATATHTSGPPTF